MGPTSIRKNKVYTASGVITTYTTKWIFIACYLGVSNFVCILFTRNSWSNTYYFAISILILYLSRLLLRFALIFFPASSIIYEYIGGNFGRLLWLVNFLCFFFLYEAIQQTARLGSLSYFFVLHCLWIMGQGWCLLVFNELLNNNFKLVHNKGWDVINCGDYFWLSTWIHLKSASILTQWVLKHLLYSFTVYHRQPNN